MKGKLLKGSIGRGQKESRGRPEGQPWAGGLRASQLSRLCLAAAACPSRHGHRCGDRWGPAAGFGPAQQACCPPTYRQTIQRHWTLFAAHHCVDRQATSTTDLSAKETNFQQHRHPQDTRMLFAVHHCVDRQTTQALRTRVPMPQVPKTQGHFLLPTAT